MKSFKCVTCGFFFSLDADYDNMSEKEYKTLTTCPCGSKMEEVPFSEDMIPTIEI